MSSKPKLLIISDYYIPHWTGIASSVYRLTQVIKPFTDITVLTVKHDNSLQESEKIDDINIIRVKPIVNVSRAKYSFRLITKAREIIPQFDLILINSPCTNIAPLAFLVKRFHHKLFILHHGDLILPLGLFNRSLEKIFDLSSAYAFRLSDTLITYTLDYARHSRVLKSHLPKLKKITIPPLKNFAREETQLPKLTAIKHKYKFICGFAGRFVEEKGFDILFQAIPLIVNKLPQTHFVFAGETNIFYENFFDACQPYYQLAKKNLTLLGLLDQAQMTNFYKQLDLIIIPSRSDCFPFVQVEAMTLGVPSVVCNIPGARDIVRQTNFGLIAPPNDPKALSERIIYALTHLFTFKKNYSAVKDYFDYEINQQQIRNTFGL